MAMSHCGVTTLDDEEIEPVSTLELYAPTMAQDQCCFSIGFVLLI